MKISDLNLKNWRGFEYYDLKPAHINVLLGPNGSGKSSILESIKTALNGKTPTDHIMAGKPFASVAASIDRVGLITRTWTVGKPSKVTANGRTTTQKSIVESIQSLYGISPKTTTIMSSSDVVEGMFGNDFSKYILSFLKNDMDVDKLVALCAPSPVAEKIMRELLPAAPAVISLEEIDAAYENLRLQRTSVKKAREVAVAKSDYRGIVPKRTMKEVSEKLMQCHEAIGKMTALERAYADSLRALKAKEENIRVTQAKIDAITVTAPTALEIKALDDEITRTREVITEQQSLIRVLNDTYARLAKIVEKLETTVCPISDKLICTTDKSGLRSELEESMKSAKEQGSAADEKKRQAQSRLVALESRKADFNKRAADYRVKLVLQDQLEKLKAMKVAVAAKPDEEKKKQIEEFIGRLEAERSLIEAYAIAKKAQEDADRLAEQVDAYEELVTLFSPKGGARQKVLEHNLGPLQDYCNERMKKLLPKYTMLLDASNGFNVLLSDAHGDCITFDALSNGEKIRVIYILTSMLNELNQFRILVLDDLDGLDRDSLQALVNLVVEDEASWDHVFFAAVNNTEANDVLGAIPGAQILKMTSL